MSKKEDRRLVVCEHCGRTYPGYENENGELHVVGGPACPNCESISFGEIDFAPSLTLSCPNCGTAHRETVDIPHETSDVVTTGHDPDGIVQVTCAQCGEEFDVGYEATL